MAWQSEHLILQTAPGLSSGLSFLLTLVSKRRKVKMGLCATIIIIIILITRITIIANNIYFSPEISNFVQACYHFTILM